ADQRAAGRPAGRRRRLAGRPGSRPAAPARRGARPRGAGRAAAVRGQRVRPGPMRRDDRARARHPAAALGAAPGAASRRTAGAALTVRIAVDTSYAHRGVSGTGVYSARLVAALRDQGVEVVELRQPARMRRGGANKLRSAANAALDLAWTRELLPRAAAREG